MTLKHANRHEVSVPKKGCCESVYIVRHPSKPSHWLSSRAREGCIMQLISMCHGTYKGDSHSMNSENKNK